MTIAVNTMADDYFKASMKRLSEMKTHFETLCKIEGSEVISWQKLQSVLNVDEPVEKAMYDKYQFMIDVAGKASFDALTNQKRIESEMIELSKKADEYFETLK